MVIRTKIVATVGPASSDPDVLERMARAGADVFRVNFSHGDEESRAEVLSAIRRVEEKIGEPLAVMADLCGPKIRVGPIFGGSCLLAEGSSIAIVRDPVEGSPEAISTTLAELIDHVECGQTLLLDDGRIRLRVAETHPPERIACRVTDGGILAGGKGVNLPETDLKLPALTEKDRRDVAWIAERDFDFVALSFVQRPEDVRELRRLLPEEVRIVAKIEKPQALARVEAIVASADAIMVARGDLGVEMPLARVPLEQKRLAGLARRSGKACIVATQMLESMTHARTPTRAEAADIANAVLDGTDAVMLSGETAVGEFPVACVATMNAIAAEAEDYQDEHPLSVKVTSDAEPTAAAMTAAVRAVVEGETIVAAAVYTNTGATAELLAKQRLGVPILAMSANRRVVRQMCLYYGVRPVLQAPPEHTREVLAAAEGHLKRMGLAEAGDRVVVLSGRPIGQAGKTNTLVVHTVG